MDSLNALIGFGMFALASVIRQKLQSSKWTGRTSQIMLCQYALSYQKRDSISALASFRDIIKSLPLEQHDNLTSLLSTKKQEIPSCMRPSFIP
mmetsp:Transcript_770/g.1161  ORF Transcript_770/g.1161 Transcript_770/m.1161 type:complete len:93 (+) Transcript_770:392-670(+)